MKAIVSVIAVLTLAGGAFAQAPQVYTPPANNPTAPTFVNAQVVRVDPSGRTITFRSGSGDTVLMVEGEALSGLAGLHAGDQVMLGYRVDTRDGRSTRIVTNIRPVVPAASARPGPSRATTIESVRVVAVNPSKRTLTIDDGTGARRVLPVSRDAAGSLRRLRAGDDVVLSYRSGKGAARTVSRIEAVGASAGGPATQVIAVSPPVTGSSSTTTTTTTVIERPVGVVSQPAASAPGGIPLPSNQAGAPAVMQPVPNVGPPTTPTLNVALPPATAGSSADAATAAQAEAIRAQGERDLQAAAAVLALKANEIDGLWFGFKDLCLGGTTPPGASTTAGREWFILLGGSAIKQPTDDACRQRQADLTRAAQQFQQQLSIATDSARKADVLPGSVREILQRNRLDR